MKATFRPSNRIISIEIGDGLIKIAEVGISKGKKQITRLISKKISDDPAEISLELKDIFQSLKPIPEEVQINIPRHFVTARYLKIPSVDDQEINKIMKIESMKHLPYTDEKVIYGHRIIEKTSDGYSKILLVIAQASVVNDFIDILNKAQIGGLKFLSLSSEALFSWYILATEGREREDVMVVNLDSGHIDINIIEKDKLVFTRGIACSARDPKIIDKITSEINISMNTYQKESSKTVSKIILTGQKKETEEYKIVLSKKSKVPIEILNDTQGMSISEDVEIPQDGVSFAELLGLLLKSEDMKINLLPEEAKEEVRFVLSKNNLITAIFLFLLFITVIFGIFIKKLHDKYVYLSGINIELKKIEPKVVAAKKVTKDMNIIQEVVAEKPLAIDIVSELYGITPNNISLSMVSFERKKTVTMRGSSQALGDVLKYVTVLENSPYFKGAKVKYANKRMAQNMEMVDFEIEVALSKSK